MADTYFKNNLAYTSVNQISDPFLSLSGWIFMLSSLLNSTTTTATTHLHPKYIMCTKGIFEKQRGK